MVTTRDPLGALDINQPSTSTSHANAKPSSSRKPTKLAPIFTHAAKRDLEPRIPHAGECSASVRPDTHPSSSPYSDGTDLDSSSPCRKRVKLTRTSSIYDSDEEEHEEYDRLEAPSLVKRRSMIDYFSTTTSGRDARVRADKQVEQDAGEPSDAGPSQAGWRRRRGRLGITTSKVPLMTSLDRLTLNLNYPSYLSTLVTCNAPLDPITPPSVIFLPSHHPPTGYFRDYSPPLSVAYNSVAKHYDASSAAQMGKTRMLAIGGEEGGVRIMNIDEGIGRHREAKGLWWRAHSNAIFDIKWSGDDSRILTASGDQTTRIHSLDGPEPRLLATMRGHTSSIKTTVFFDPTRSHMDPTTTSSVIASAGRDGHILIYDLRCQTRPTQHSSPLTVPRRRPDTSGFAIQPNDQILDPVMTIKNAHGDGSRRISPHRTALRSVTSLVALQAMPGMLASGGSYDGIVKLWDLRMPGVADKKSHKPTATPYGELPDATTNCANPSRRPRSVNALVESPTTGDLFALCGDSKIHALRPAYARSSEETPDTQAVLPRTYTAPNLRVSTFYLRAAISPDGKHLACGSGKGGVMTWDVDGKVDSRGEVQATRLRYDQGREADISALDWGHDMLAACAGDSTTRIWRSRQEADGLLTTADWWGEYS